MDDKLWEFESEKIEPQELTEREKQLAKEYAEIEMEFEEAISMIDFNQEK